MPRSIVLLLSLATLSGTVAFAQAGPADPATTSYLQSEPAPIEHSYANAYPNEARNFAPDAGTSGYDANQPPRDQRSALHTMQPVQGVLVHTAPDAVVQTVSSAGDVTELRVVSGVANVNVHHPADHAQILVDLPGGQTSLLKDGLYTFNASTNTVRVFKGEAEAYSDAGKKHSVKVKEEHYVAFNGGELHAMEGNVTTARADILPGVYAESSNEEGYRRPYGYGPYGDGFYGGYPYGYGAYPYYAYGYPYGFYGGYPYGYGLGIGLGFGYYGGGYGRGFYGGGGFRGRR